MLQTIRDRLTGWVAGFLFFIIALAFAFWGIDPMSVGVSWAAKVNGEEIPANEVRQAAQSQISQFEAQYRTELTEPMKDRVRSDVLNQFIQNALLTQRVDEEGYRVSDAMLIKHIQSIPRFLVGGEFSHDTYQATLRSFGLSVAGFERDQRAQLEVQQLQMGLLGSAFVTPGEVRRFIELQNETREIEVITVPVSLFAAESTPSEEEIIAYYESDPERFLNPETANIEYVEIDAGDFADQIEIDDAGLRAYYEEVADRFQSEEQRRARHILIAVDADTDDSAANELATSLVARIRSGEDFSKLAAEFSDDGGTSSQGGDLGWAVPDDFVGPFADALFEMKVGDVAGPIQTRFGYHVIALDEIKPQQVQPFSEVREEIEDEYRQIQSEDLYYEARDKLAKESFEAFDQLQSVADSLGLEINTETGFTRVNGGALGTDPKIIDAVFGPDAIEPGRNSDLIELEGGRAVVLRVINRQLATAKPLAEVRDQIVALLVTNKARDRAAEAGETIKAELLAGGVPEQAALEHAAGYAPPIRIGRAAANAPRVLVDAAFAAQRPGAEARSVTGVSLDTGDYAVINVKSVSAGQPASLSIEEWNNTERQIASQAGNREYAAYIDGLRTNSKIKINQNTFEPASQGPVLP